MAEIPMFDGGADGSSIVRTGSGRFRVTFPSGSSETVDDLTTAMRVARPRPPAGYEEIIWRRGDVVVRLREQVTQPPVDPVGLRLLLDWAAETIEELRAVAVRHVCCGHCDL